MVRSVSRLAESFYLTGHEPYAAKAAELLRAWFLDEETLMNPNLEFGQAIPGRCDGRGIGIIETRQLTRVVDAAGLLAGSPSWTHTDEAALRNWFGDYLTWLLESPHGRDEAKTRNNHGTHYDVQVAAFALYVGREELARRVLDESARGRLVSQIEPDGSQPHELARTNGWSYSLMNLGGFFDLARLGENVGVDLWNYETDDGRSIRKALEWLMPFAAGDRKWEHQQISGFRASRLRGLLEIGARKWNDPRYSSLASQLTDRER
jgi:hypothetical protein